MVADRLEDVVSNNLACAFAMDTYEVDSSIYGILCVEHRAGLGKHGKKVDLFTHKKLGFSRGHGLTAEPEYAAVADHD